MVFPEGAWAQERVLPCLAEVATNNPAYEEPPPQPDPNDGARVLPGRTPVMA